MDIIFLLGTARIMTMCNCLPYIQQHLLKQLIDSRADDELDNAQASPDIPDIKDLKNSA